VLTTDLTAIAQVATYPSMIVVHPSLPVKSMKELIALARAKPDALNFGASPGSPNHLAMELVKVMTKVKMTYIGYKGTGPVITDLLGGHLHCASVGFPGVSPHVASGRLRALAVTTTKRSALFPDLPTVAESAIPNYHVSSWWGVFGPARLPPQIVGRLNTEIRGFMDGDDVKARLSGLGADVETTTSEEFAKIVRSEVVRWAPIVKASGAKAP
jgi:tripartite-type tricarboxylate transporter receptor subunit TctC